MMKATPGAKGIRHAVEWIWRDLQRRSVVGVRFCSSSVIPDFAVGRSRPQTNSQRTSQGCSEAMYAVRSTMS